MYSMNNPMMSQYQNNNIGYPYSLSNNISPQSLIRVSGLEGAKAYQMSANSQVALFDNNEDLMYIKMTDGAGFPTIRTFKFNEVFNNKPQIDNSDFVSKNEFEAFKKEVSSYVEQLIQQPISKTPKQGISADDYSE